MIPSFQAMYPVTAASSVILIFAGSFLLLLFTTQEINPILDRLLKAGCKITIDGVEQIRKYSYELSWLTTIVTIVYYAFHTCMVYNVGMEYS